MEQDEPLDPADLHWLAGLLEGEGSFFPGPPTSPGLPVIRLSMVDADVVARAGSLFERRVHFDRARRSHWKPSWSVTVKGAPAVGWMRTLRPLMGQRRQEQIDRALASYRPDPRRVLDDRGASEALSALAEGKTVREVAERLGTSIWTIYDLRLGRTYRHLDRPAAK